MRNMKQIHFIRAPTCFHKKSKAFTNYKLQIINYKLKNYRYGRKNILFTTY